MNESYYSSAQICLNGHTTTAMTESSPERMSKFCPDCGEETITQCPDCETDIRGYWHVPGVISAEPYEPPKHCHDCGNPFPWTARSLEAANELTEEIDGLTAEEKSSLRASILELTRSGPKAEVAAIRYKRLVKKAGSAIGSALNQIVISVASEAAKQQLGLGR